MAERLARIYGTEEDKLNCPFYYKIGACRHGDRCSRQHNRPLFSQTLLIPHMYTLPPVDPTTGLPTVNEKEHLTDFCEEVIEELQTFGSLEEFHVVANLGEHMLGNVYLKYSSEDEAAKALAALNGRFYGGRQLVVEFSPVSDFRESRCRQYDEETCSRGAFCNFVHMRPLPSVIRRELERIREKQRRREERRREEQYRERERGGGGGRQRSRSRSRDRDRDRDGRRGDPRDSYSSSSSRSGGPSSSSSAAAASSSSGGPRRSPSEERRARFAELNRAREAKLAQEREQQGGSGGAPPPPPPPPPQH